MKDGGNAISHPVINALKKYKNLNENAKHNKRTSIIIIMASEIKKIFFFYNYRLKLVKKLTFFLILFMHYLPAFIFAFFVVMTLKQTNYCIMIIMILL